MAARQITADAVRDRLDQAIRAYGAGTQAGWAKAHGLSTAYVNDVLRGRRGAGPGILGALGLKKPDVVAEVR